MELIQSSKMKRENSPQDKLKKNVQLFSDMMLMKFKPKNTQGLKMSKKPVVHSRRPSEDRPSSSPATRPRLPVQISFLQLASKDAVVIGNASQLDMINIDGLSHNFVDTYYYWSLNLSRPIDNVKLSINKQLMLILSGRTLLLYGYNTIKKEKSEPTFISLIELNSDVRFMQFPSSDIIALFYDDHLEVYSLNDANSVSKRLQKPYNVGKAFKLFAVPQAIDHTINVFFQEVQTGRKTFGLWCLEVRLTTQNTKVSAPYKIYDIMCGLKKVLILQNYSKDIIFLNLGQEILVARKGYIVDSVNINVQADSSYLRYLPRQQILVHIQRSSMDLYSFTIDTAAVPHRIKLTSLDSIQIVNRRPNSRLISLLPVLDHNYALFYEDDPPRPTTKGEVFYSFVLSYTVDLTRKVHQILGSGRNPSELPEEELEGKCEVLRKVGMSDQEIYLQIWRRSGRVSLRDYQLLLATRDYRTIKNEIEEKLKKQSMNFKEVLKIQQSCLQILRPKIESQQCNEQLLKDFLTCSLFLRKLSLWKELQQLSERDKDKGLYINIQDYFQLKNMELKQFVLERVGLFLFGGKNNLHELRVILHHFRFVYRYIYRQLLERIIITSKNELKRLLEVIPQLLPIGNKNDKQQGFLYSGIWSGINEEEWESGLHLQRVANVSNRQIVQQFVEGLWFKRNWLTMHDLIPKSKVEIEQANQRNNSVEIFYYFIWKVFDTIKDAKVLRELLSYMELNYQQLPNHIRDKILLYSTLYSYYKGIYKVANCPAFTFAQFLQLRDYNLFKYFFDLEKMKKNSLLREIKPIYEQLLGPNGVTVFNESLFNYFKSQVSQVSNLKYLLNRINNEKKEFHMLHEPMYEVLIKAMQFKLRIGSASDVPVQEVLIYIENIPINPHNQAMLAELDAIRRVSDQSETFRKMRINMTIRQIIDNYETVIERLVQYQFKKNSILGSDSLAIVLPKTYRLLAQVQSIKEKIYGTQFNQLAFFIYLTKLLEHQNKITIAQDILNDPYLNNYYFIDLKIIQSLVLYMYRWKFSQEAAFTNNQTYIIKLCELLPSDNHMREYIEHELAFALLLSTQSHPVLYPIVAQATAPRIIDLQTILRSVDDAHIVRVDIERIVDAMRKMEELSHGLSQLNKNSLISKESLFSQKIQENAVYKVFINSFIARNLIKEVVPLVRRSIQSAEKPQVITTLIMIYYLLPQLNEQCKVTLVKIASYLYVQPLKLLEVVQNLLTKRLTGLENIDYLHKVYNVLRINNSNFNEDNPIFNVYFIHLSDEWQRKNKKVLVENTLIKLKKTKPEFQHQFIFDLIFTILCYEPIYLAVFLHHIRTVKWRNVRNFISYLIQEEIFDQILTLEASKRTFFLLLRSYKEKCDIYRLTSQYSEKSLVEEFKIKTYEDLNQFQKQLEKNVTAFLKKKDKITGLSRSFRLKKNSLPDKEVSIKESIKNPQTYKQKSVNNYAFSDSDDDYQNNDEQIQYKETGMKIHQKIHFDPKNERKNFIRKDRKANIQVRKISPLTKRPHPEKISHEADASHKDPTKIKKFLSLNVQVGEKITNNDNNQVSTPGITRVISPQRQPSNETQQPSSGRTLKHKRTFEQEIKKKQSKQFKKMDECKGVSQDDSDDEPLLLSNKISEQSQQRKLSQQDEFDETASITLKKIYRTYDDKQEKTPYNLRILQTEKTKNVKGFNDLIKQVIKKIYNKPDRSMENSFKLIIQIAKSFPEVCINIQNAEIFEKIAKFETKYGLQLPIQKILPYEGLYLASKTPEQLFSFIKQSILQICDDENIFKISKLISIGFKKNTIEQQIILLYLNKLIAQLNLTVDYAELGVGLQKIKGLISKMQVRTLVQKTETIVDQCTHFDLRRKLVQICIDTIRMKGNGKDAKELANKLK